jgi:hypothetical protein
MDISVGLGRSSGAVDSGGCAAGGCRVVGSVVGATALSTPGSAPNAVPMSVTQRVRVPGSTTRAHAPRQCSEQVSVRLRTRHVAPHRPAGLWAKTRCATKHEPTTGHTARGTGQPAGRRRSPHRLIHCATTHPPCGPPPPGGTVGKDAVRNEARAHNGAHGTWDRPASRTPPVSTPPHPPRASHRRGETVASRAGEWV